MKKKRKNPKICIVSSCGGHLTEVRCLLPVFRQYEHFYVLNNKSILPEDMKGKTQFICHAERNLKVLKNFLEAFIILRREKPTIILSTGAGPVVPFAVVGKWLYGCHIVFVETITRVDKPSLTGRIMYRIADDFFYQWASLARFFPRGIHGGALI